MRKFLGKRAARASSKQVMIIFTGLIVSCQTPNISSTVINIQDYEEEDAPVQDGGAAAPPEVDNDHLCVICIDREKNAVMIPCGHARFCDPCGQDLMIRERPEPRCPLCREPVAQCYRLR